MLIYTSQSKFPLGALVATANALAAIGEPDIVKGVGRHALGDWGDLDTADKASNDEALARGLRIVSAYQSVGGVSFWIITEWDRSSTTVLLPEDY